jgi:hypothetical protein
LLLSANAKAILPPLAIHPLLLLLLTQKLDFHFHALSGFTKDSHWPRSSRELIPSHRESLLMMAINWLQPQLDDEFSPISPSQHQLFQSSRAARRHVRAINSGLCVYFCCLATLSMFTLPLHHISLLADAAVIQSIDEKWEWLSRTEF